MVTDVSESTTTVVSTLPPLLPPLLHPPLPIPPLLPRELRLLPLHAVSTNCVFFYTAVEIIMLTLELLPVDTHSDGEVHCV